MRVVHTFSGRPETEHRMSSQSFDIVSASQQILDEVTSWPGVSAGRGARGELSFKLGPREIGHLHGNDAAHFGFPRHVWVDLRKQGRIERHPVFRDSVGPAARRIGSESDVRDVIALLRLNYERLMQLRRTA
jgi:hypothetical protein